MSMPQPSSQPTPSPTAFAISTRVMAGALMGALPVIALALFFILGDTLRDPVPWVILGAVLAAGVVVHVLTEAIGYRVPVLERGLPEAEAHARARQGWIQTMVLRFPITEFVAIASLAAAFAVGEGGYWIYLTGMVISLVLMWVHVWPRARTVDRVASKLEADGVPSGLREAFGHA